MLYSKKLFLIIRLVSAVGLLIFLLQKIGMEQIRLTISSAKPAYFVLVYGVLIIDVILRSYSWKTVLNIKKYIFPFREMLYNYFVSCFFGTFIPSSLGTDVTRAIFLNRRNGVSLVDSTTAIMVLNSMALLSLFSLNCFSALSIIKLSTKSTIVWIISILFVLLLLTIVSLIIWRIDKGQHLEKYYYGKLYVKKARKLCGALRSYGEHRSAMILILLVALLNQFLSITIVYIISLSIGLNVSFLTFVNYVPVITLSRIMPISIAGFGAEQGIFVFLFAKAGIPAAESFLISVILSLTILTLSILGGGIYSIDICIKLIKKNIKS